MQQRNRCLRYALSLDHLPRAGRFGSQRAEYLYLLGTSQNGNPMRTAMGTAMERSVERGGVVDGEGGVVVAWGATL